VNLFATRNFTLCTAGNISSSKISVNNALNSQQYFLQHVSVNVTATFISSHFETSRLTEHGDPPTFRYIEVWFWRSEAYSTK
jgi:hypothetical protein